MLRPIKTIALKKAGLSLRFARRVMARTAVPGSYDLSESELVFAMGAAREKYDLMSVLELMDEALGLLRRGFDRRANRLIAKIVNNIAIILGRGGFSRAYSNVLEIYDKLSSVVENGGEGIDISRFRADIRGRKELLAKDGTLEIFRGNSLGGLSGIRVNVSGGTARGDRRADIYERASRRGSITLNTLNSGLLRISARNPELLKRLKSDRNFRALSVENIGRLHRRGERSVLAIRFLDAVTEEQIGMLERFVISEDLFSELREMHGERQGLKFLIENSSERGLARFFETLKQRIEQGGTLSEKSFFRSAEDMKDFFIRATRGEVEQLISRLERERLYGDEVRTLVGALRIYDENTKAQKPDDEIRAAALELSEFEKVSETELRNIVNSADFSEERFIESLKSSSTLKNAFAEFAWENYRSEKTLGRYREYIENLSERNKTLPSENDSVIKTEDRGAQVSLDYKNSGSSASDKAAKERFAEFMINSGELSLIFSESVKNDFLNASADVTAAFAEYLVSVVREDGFAYFNDRVRGLAEKAEDILYRHDTDLGSKSAAVFSLIRSEWERCSPQVSEMYAAFTQRGRYEEIIKFYSRMPKDDRAAVSELFFAAAQDNADADSRSAELLTRLEKILAVTGRYSAENSRYAFYDAVNGLSGSAFESLKTLVELRDAESYSAVLGNSANESLFDERAAALVISAAFTKYLLSEIRGGAARYSERMRELAERVAIIINNEYATVGSRAAEALELIYNTQNGGAEELSRLYKDFADHCCDSEKLLEAYSRQLESGFDSVSEKISSDGGKVLFSEYIEALTERPDALIEQLRAAVGGSFTLNSEKYSAKLLDLLGEKRGELQGDRFVRSAERVKLIIRDDEIDIKERMAKTLELIQSAEGGSAELSELYERFSERYSDKQTLLDIYSRLPGSEFGDLAEGLSSDKDETQRTEFSERVLERSEKLIERLRGVDKQRGDVISQSKAVENDDKIERAAELVVLTAFSKFLSSAVRDGEERSGERLRELTERRERLERGTKRVIHSDSANYYREAARLASDNIPAEESGALSYTAGFAPEQASKRIGLAEKIMLQKLLMTESLSRLRPSPMSAGHSFGSYVYSQLQSSGGASVNKTFCKAFLAFEGGLDSESGSAPYSVAVPREYLYTLESGGVIQFNRLAADRLRVRTSEFLKRRKTFTEAVSERMAEKILLSDRFMERNSAVELFYTDDYIESGFDSAVNYAIPATSLASGNSNDVSDKLKALHSAVESIGSELEQMKNRETELSREFVTKSEQRVFEKEFRSSIEQDIYLAGKRHGIY